MKFAVILVGVLVELVEFEEDVVELGEDTDGVDDGVIGILLHVFENVK